MASDKTASPLLSGVFPSILAALIFVAALLPIAGNFVFFHPDERHYTNAPIFMMQSGDWLTPRNGQGKFRFKKPIMTYWAVLGSYQAFGVGALSLRLPFLLAGAIVIWLTYQLTMMLFGGRATALIASLIMATHPLMITAAVRANPDMLMVMCLLISVYGFFGMMLSNRPRPIHHYAAYLGIGLAVAVKGPLPVLVFAGISLLFALYNPWRRVPLANLIHLPSMLLAFVVAVSWFIAMFVLHGAEGLGLFLNDHLTGRVDFQWGELIAHMAAAFAGLALLFLPWNLILLHLGIKGEIKQAVKSSRNFALLAGFAALWAAAIIVMSGPVKLFYPRYVLPVVPLFAILLAHVLTQVNVSIVLRWARVLVIIALLLSLPFLAGALLMALAGSDGMVLAATAVALLLSTAFAVSVFRTRILGSMVLLCASILLLLPSLYLFAKPFALPDQGSQVITKLKQLDLVEGKRIAYLGNTQPAAKIRIAAGPKLELHEVRRITAETLADFDAVIFMQERRPDDGQLSGFNIALAARSWSTPPLERLLAASSLDEAAQILRRPNQIHYVAWRPQATVEVTNQPPFANLRHSP